ncbi:MAG: PKD-like domain-containing protein, partial [Dolichospermum sp.]
MRYQWSVLDSNSIRGARVGNGPTINNTLINPSAVRPDTVFYTVNITSDNCTITPIIVPVIVLPAPKVVAQNQTICANQATNIALSSLAGAGNFSWSVNSSSANISGATSGTGSTIIQQLFNSSSSISGTIVYAIRATVNGCIGPDTLITVTVNPLPVVILNERNLEFCDTGLIAVNIQSSISSSTLDWFTVSEGPIIGFSNGSGNNLFQTVRNTSRTQIGRLKYIFRALSNGCFGPNDTLSITINPKPNSDFEIALDSVYCVGSRAVFSNLTPPILETNTRFQWDFGNDSSSNSFNGSTIYRVPGRYNVKLKSISSSGCIDSIIKQIKVVSLPQASISASTPANNCSPVIISFT